MSTRANIIIKSGNDQQIFYRHSDGYPKGTLPTLNLFLQWVKEGKIRNNVSQSAGWLILIGHDEYAKGGTGGTVKDHLNNTQNGEYSFVQWKASAYEPDNVLAYDAEYIYVIDLDKKSISVYEPAEDENGNIIIGVEIPLTDELKGLIYA